MAFQPTQEQMDAFQENKASHIQFVQDFYVSDGHGGEFTEEQCKHICSFLEECSWSELGVLCMVFGDWLQKTGYVPTMVMKVHVKEGQTRKSRDRRFF